MDCSNAYDVIVAGLGAMGSASAYHLAARGMRVLGLDRFKPPHEFGSSHGLTRIIREAYFEHPAYVPLVQRAYALWADLEKKSGRRLFVQTGGIMIGPAEGILVSGARKSAEEHGLRHEVLSSTELRRRFPVLEPTPEMVGVWEPRAGVLFPELAIEAHLELAARQGVVLRFNEPVTNWEADGQNVRVHTAAGTYTASRLVLAVGSWIQGLVQANLSFRIERQVLYWFEPRDQIAVFQPSKCPIHLWEYGPARFFYGFPELGDGVKVAVHHQGESVLPETVDREVSVAEVESMRGLLRRFVPSAEGRLRSTAVCLYTNTPDEHFVLDWHPAHPQVLVCSPCSGHGFKFSSSVGEVAAELLCHQTPRFDLSLFRINRFRKS